MYFNHCWSFRHTFNVVESKNLTYFNKTPLFPHTSTQHYRLSGRAELRQRIQQASYWYIPVCTAQNNPVQHQYIPVCASMYLFVLFNASLVSPCTSLYSICSTLYSLVLPCTVLYSLVLCSTVLVQGGTRQYILVCTAKIWIMSVPSYWYVPKKLNLVPR